MDKTILRNVLTNLQPNQSISAQMRGRATSENYTVIEVKKGRGKHGSLTATIQRSDGTVINVGTPKNLDILNLTVNGEFHGVHNEREEPPVYQTDVVQAVNLKTTLKTALDRAGEEGKTVRIRFESNIPEYNGVFSVVNRQNEKGKHGQLHLWLVPEGQTATPENTVELWSYRHSGIIQNFEVLP